MADELNAAQLFEGLNDEEVPPRPLTAAEQEDAELAQLLHTQFESGYTSDNDHSAAPAVYECACGDSFTERQLSQLVMLNCGCPRCNDCLNGNIAVGLESRRSYPPRCCGIEIEIPMIQEHLTEAHLNRWIEVKDEYRDKAPVYCAVKTCSAYLTKDTLDQEHRWALCSKCNVKTCTGCLCLESDHTQANQCPEHIDKLDKELFEKERWKPCPGCKLMVEKAEGCDHMTCDCGTEFCYGCGGEYIGGMPCNCAGQRDWVDDEPEANDAAMQQQIIDGLANLGHEDREFGEELETNNGGRNGDGWDTSNDGWNTQNDDWSDQDQVNTDGDAAPWHGTQDWGVGQQLGTDEVVGEDGEQDNAAAAEGETTQGPDWDHAENTWGGEQQW